MKITIYDNPIEITNETIQATRKWFADNAQACIDGATNSEWKVNDLPEYIAFQKRNIEASLRGDYDHTFTFVQKAIYIQTGQSVPLLT